MPFLAAGVIVSSVATVLIDRSIIEKAFGGGFLKSTCAAVLLAFMVPVCETGEAPVARALLANGASPGPVVTYILSASSFNPLIIAMTVMAFPDNHGMAWSRVAVTLVIAVGAGALFRALPNRFSLRGDSSFYAFSWGEKLFDTKYASADAGHAEGNSKGSSARFSEKLLVALEIARDELFYLLRFLIAGAAASAFIRLFVTQKQILGMSGGTGAAIFAFMVLGIFLCLNSNIDSSYAAAIPGAYAGEAVLGFLVAGSMMDLKSMSMLLSVFRARAVAVMAAIVYASTFILCVISKYIFF